MSGILLWTGVGVMGGVGACARFGLGSAVSRLASPRFPWGTLTVNVLGCLALGILAGRHVAGDVLLLVGTGLLGAFTTFSTWMLEVHRLVEARRPGTGAAYLVVSLVAGAAAFLLGRIVLGG